VRHHGRDYPSVVHFRSGNGMCHNQPAPTFQNSTSVCDTNRLGHLGDYRFDGSTHKGIFGINRTYKAQQNVCIE
jgi:hypothetical protein